MRYLLGHRSRRRPVVEDVAPFKITGVYCRLIPLTQGLWAIVDAADYEWLMQWTWCAARNQGTHGYYAVRRETGLDGKRYTIRMHRFLLGLQHGDPLNGDHRNGCGIDNREKNIRPADDFENAQNRGPNSNNTSGCKGVRWDESMGYWIARITFRGKTIHLGAFPKHRFEVAKAAYERAALELFGEFARVN